MSRQDLSIDASESTGDGYQTQTGSAVGANFFAGHVASFSGDRAFAADYTDSDNIYLGYADLGSLGSASVWMIKKVIISGSTVAIKHADGNANYDNIWDNRASLTYV